jgi:hypothetical protein
MPFGQVSIRLLHFRVIYLDEIAHGVAPAVELQSEYLELEKETLVGLIELSTHSKL